jgi:hypothetical protein
MRIWRRSNAPTERDLLGLADGSLRGQRRADVERKLDDRPDLRSALAAQRRVLKAIEHAGAQEAPHALRARLALARPPARPRARTRIAGLAAAGSAGVAGVVVGVIVALSGSSAVALASVVRVASLTDRAPTRAVGEPSAGVESLPRVRGAGLSYPYWGDRFGFRATGVRYDAVGGHRVTTVFYSRGSSHVAYEIVSGAPLSLGAPAGREWRQGVLLRTLSAQSAPVVSWMRDGHTCVLVGDHAALPVLLKLAAWRQGGRIAY